MRPATALRFRFLPSPGGPVDARRLGAMLLVALAYVAGGKLGLSLALLNPSATAVWPPTGIAIAALLLLGRRAWPGVFVGAFVVNLLTAGGPVASLGIATGNTLEAWVAAWLVGRFANGPGCFDRAVDVGGFAVLAGLLSTMVSATVGVGVLLLLGLVAPSAGPAVWLTWWLGDAAGALLVAPFVVLWARQPRIRLPAARAVEALVVASAVAAVAAMVFAGLAGPAQASELRYLALPPVLWVAFRFGPRATVTVTGALASAAVWGTLRGHGAVGQVGPNDALLFLQLFMAVLTVTGLVLAAAVAERSRSEAALRAARDELEERVRERTASLLAAQRAAHLGTWEWDVLLDRMVMSDEMHRILGTGTDRGVPAPASSEAFFGMVHPDDQPVVRALVERSLQEGTLAGECRVLRPEGTVRVLLLHADAERDAGGRAVRMTGTAQDITERKETEQAAGRLKDLERLKELDAFKTQFLNAAAHELGTPLTPIRLQLELLGEAEMDERGRRSVVILERNVRRLSDLVRDVLEAARMQAGRLSVRPVSIDLGALMRESCEAFEEPARRGDVALEVDVPEALWVEADADRIAQVVLNLLTNAWKFTPAGGRIAITARPEGGEAVVRIQDSGVGLDEEQLAGLFQPFSQMHGPRAGAGGTGLGLFISKGLVELHGGRIWAESPGPGQGSTFGFALPLTAAEAQPRRGAQAAQAGAKR